jgi:hypothetical protein
MNVFSKNKVFYFLLILGVILALIPIPSLIRGDFKEFLGFDYKQDSTESASELELLLIGLVLIVISIWSLIKKRNKKLPAANKVYTP